MSDTLDPVLSPDDGVAAPVDTLGQTPHEPKTRPWEQELLISGATVFALLQLPGQVDAWSRGVMPRLDGAWFVGAVVVWMYVRLALYALITGFVAHLAIRAYWVGVIGLEAVFPNGINWENTRGGPIMRAVQRRRMPALQTLIDRADRLASVVFASGITVALFCAFGLLVGMVLAAGILVAARVSGGNALTRALVFDAIILVGVLPIMGAALFDRVYGHRLDPDGRVARTIRGIAQANSRMWVVMPFIPLMLTITSNLRRRKGSRAVIFAVLIVGGVLALQDRIAPGLLSPNGYRYLPDGVGTSGVDTRFYEDARSDEQIDGKAPSIQSDMVRDPYVRLFIPYRPIRHNDLVAARCPAARTLTGARGEAAVIACMLRLQPVAMDGRPVTAPFRLFTQPRTELRGIVGYLPVDGLAKGEHEITVAALPPAFPSTGAKAEPPPPPYTIRFWL